MKTASKTDRARTVSAEEFDHKFDAGEDISDYADWQKAKVIYPQSKRINVDFPGWVVSALDREAERLGISRQTLIKIWIADRIGKAA